MTGRTGREVHEKIFIYGKKVNAENINPETEKQLKTEYKIGPAALTKGYTPAGETYAADYRGRYGTGKMIFNHYNSNYSFVTYLLEK